MVVSKKCSIEDCCRSALSRDGGSRGWCHAHYMRVYYTGDPQPSTPLQQKAPMGATFAYYREHILSPSTDECVRWPFAYNSRNKAVMKIGKKQHRVHRYGCEDVNGPPPTPEHHAAHSCGHDWCVNLRHVRWATPSENNQDKLGHGTHNRGERHNLAKLTAEQVLEIRHRAETENAGTIAKQFGISAWHVKSIQHRRAWSWLKEAA